MKGWRVVRNIEMVCDFFSAARRAGRFLPEAQTHTGNPEWFDPDIEIEALLYWWSRPRRAPRSSESQGGWGCPPSTVLDGHPVVFALIAQPVWDELTRTRDRPARSNL